MELQTAGGGFYCFGNTKGRIGIFDHHLLVLCEPVEGLVLAEVLLPATDLHLSSIKLPVFPFS